MVGGGGGMWIELGNPIRPSGRIRQHWLPFFRWFKERNEPNNGVQVHEGSTDMVLEHLGVVVHDGTQNREGALPDQHRNKWLRYENN